jgi:sugar O-acyltransferase (sialic acid O-acetyltransferase NeuD family)
MNRPVIIIGSGGHAAVIADALLSASETVIGFTDPDTSRHGTRICGLPVLGGDSALVSADPQKVFLANGIGGTGADATKGLRRNVQHRLESLGWTFTTVRHPSAVVSRFAHVDAGAQLLARVVVQPGARVGRGCIVNTGAIVEHDVVLGEFTHVSCGATLCGDVHVGESSHIGAGAVVRQGVRLGQDSVVGAGAVMLQSTAGGRIWVGVPARERKAQA